MNYEIVSWSHNWADEMDFSGERIQPAGTFEKWKQEVKRGQSFPWSFGVGSNQDIEFDTAEDLFSNYYVKPFEITDEEYAVLEKFGRVGDSDEAGDHMEGFGEYVHVGTCANGHLVVPIEAYDYSTRNWTRWCTECRAEVAGIDSINPFFFCPETDDHVDYIAGEGRPECDHGPASWDVDDDRDVEKIEALFGPREMR